jgi:hypothetical protein
MLAELNVKPRLQYLAKLSNPAPGTPEYEAGMATSAHNEEHGGHNASATTEAGGGGH